MKFCNMHFLLKEMTAADSSLVYNKIMVFELILVHSEERCFGYDMKASMPTSEDMEFSATFNTSSEQPGLIITFTCNIPSSRLT